MMKLKMDGIFFFLLQKTFWRQNFFFLQFRLIIVWDKIEDKTIEVKKGGNKKKVEKFNNKKNIAG